jgi:hypothetical protein
MVVIGPQRAAALRPGAVMVATQARTRVATTVVLVSS